MSDDILNMIREQTERSSANMVRAKVERSDTEPHLKVVKPESAIEE